MMKTSELTGAALDWAVAKCEGVVKGDSLDIGFILEGGYSPSTDWSQGGPIIEREDISFRKYHRPDSEAHGKYYARICRESGTMICWHKTTGHQQTGPTPLIAAMRCYVASKLGEEVDIPDELA
jgi:hypothetical protein